jgi:hypothetical protein
LCLPCWAPLRAPRPQAHTQSFSMTYRSRSDIDGARLLAVWAYQLCNQQQQHLSNRFIQARRVTSSTDA